LLDAAVRIVAEFGANALTHRAVAAGHDPQLSPVTRLLNERLAKLLEPYLGSDAAAHTVSAAMQGLVLTAFAVDRPNSGKWLRSSVSDLIHRYRIVPSLGRLPISPLSTPFSNLGAAAGLPTLQGVCLRPGAYWPLALPCSSGAVLRQIWAHDAARYAAFLQNALMSGLSIQMILARQGLRGQTLTIAVAKWLGTLAPTILVGVIQGSRFILGLDILCSVFDVLYIGLVVWFRKHPDGVASDHMPMTVSASAAN
jgi:hypothetical protein